MALCESQLDSALPGLQCDEPSPNEESPEKKPKLEPVGDVYQLNQVPAGLPLSVDYRSPVSHFVPPAVEIYAARNKHGPVSTQTNDGSSSTPPKRKRGRPRVDKTSPEYLANLAARHQAREMAAMMNASRNSSTPDSGEKRKRGRPRVDKTSPEYLARKRARELEALERKAKKEYRRRTGQAKPNGQAKMPPRLTRKLPPPPPSVRKLAPKFADKRPAVRQTDRAGVARRKSKFVRRKDSAASSSAGDTPRVKRKYTKRAPSNKNDGTVQGERVKGKRGRPRKTDVMPGSRQNQQPKIRVRNNLMPDSEPITLDSDDEPDLGSPSAASDSLSLDENLRALRHIHEKYANLDKDDTYSAHMVAVNFKKPQTSAVDDDVLSVRSSEGGASVKELETRVEKLEDSSNSDSDSSSSGSGSSTSGSSSGSSDSSSSSESSDDEDRPAPPPINNDSSSYGAWSTEIHSSDSDDPERAAPAPPPPRGDDDVSCSDNESPDKSFQCHICGKWFSTRVTLKIHRRSHQKGGGGGGRSRASDRYECDMCNESYNRRDRLLEHKAEAHRGAITFRCDVCRKCFEDDTELEAHTQTHTDDERAGRCGSCGAVFARYEQLLRHVSSAHARSDHACVTCGKRFSHVHSLTRHMHNHARQLYRCVVCKASFARADQLAQHLNSHLANYKRLKP